MVPATLPTPLIPPIADLIALLRQRDLPGALRVALARLLEAGAADGAALLFCGTLAQPIQIRLGHIPAEARATLEQWDGALRNRLEQGPLYAEVTSQARLPSGYSLVKLPLSGPEAVLGHVVLVLTPGEQLSESQFEQLRALCYVAGNVAGLLQELTQTQQQLERLGLLHEVGQALASTLDLRQLLRDTMALASEALGAQASTLMLVDPTNPNYLLFEIAQGAKREQLRRYRMARSEGVAGWVATHGQALIVNQPDEDPRFNRKVDLRTGFVTRNILCVPMQLKGNVIGVLQVLNKRGEVGFNAADQELLLTVASQAAIAIENARLVRDLRDERDRIIAAQEEVRKELARNLHDGTVQLLAAMSMSLEHAQLLATKKPEALAGELAELADLNNRAIREARTLLFELRPVVLETEGLGAALHTYLERLNQDRSRNGAVTLHLPPALPRLSQHIERTLFAIVQEAVGNARKHAQAREIAVRVQPSGSALHVTIQDNGLGFDLDSVQARYATSGSLGLLNMRERAQLIDSELIMESAAGQGTRITIRVPLSWAQKAG